MDPDSFGVKYQRLLLDFQSHMLYGFLCSVLIAMAGTNPEELDLFREAKRRGEEMEVDSAATSVASEMGPPKVWKKCNALLCRLLMIFICSQIPSVVVLEPLLAAAVVSPLVAPTPPTTLLLVAAAAATRRATSP